MQSEQFTLSMFLAQNEKKARTCLFNFFIRHHKINIGKICLARQRRRRRRRQQRQKNCFIILDDSGAEMVNCYMAWAQRGLRQRLIHEMQDSLIEDLCIDFSCTLPFAFDVWEIALCIFASCLEFFGFEIFLTLFLCLSLRFVFWLILLSNTVFVHSLYALYKSQ